MSIKQLIGFAGALLLLLVFAYWPKSSGPVRDGLPERFPVRGTVTYNGKPPVGAYVKLHPLPLKGNDPSVVVPRGRVDETGAFDISSYESKDGAPIGEYALTLVWTGFADPHVKPGPDRWRGRFNSPRKPLQTVAVEDQEVEIPAIELDGPKVSAGAAAKSNSRAKPGGRPNARER